MQEIYLCCFKALRFGFYLLFHHNKKVFKKLFDSDVSNTIGLSFPSNISVAENWGTIPNIVSLCYRD